MNTHWSPVSQASWDAWREAWAADVASGRADHFRELALLSKTAKAPKPSPAVAALADTVPLPILDASATQSVDQASIVPYTPYTTLGASVGVPLALASCSVHSMLACVANGSCAFVSKNVDGESDASMFRRG